MKKVIILFMGLFILSIPVLKAQDYIYKKNREVILCKISQVGVKTIKYTQPKYNSGIEFTISKNLVKRIVFASGDTIDLIKDYLSPEDYSRQRKDIIKFEFFSPLSGNLTLGYEHSLRLQRSIEASIGIIGLGSNIYYSNARGVFFKLGYKFIRSPEVYFNAKHYSHILKGFFVRPDIMFSYFSYDGSRNGLGGDFNNHIRNDNFSLGLLINVGKQWVLNDQFSVSWNVGVGYAFSTEAGYYYSHIAPFGNVFPIAFSAGLSVGILP